MTFTTNRREAPMSIPPPSSDRAARPREISTQQPDWPAHRRGLPSTTAGPDSGWIAYEARDDTHADGVQPEGEVLHPRRLKFVLMFLGLSALTAWSLINPPSTMFFIGSVFFALVLSVAAVSLIPGAMFLSIGPDALQVRLLYRDAYFRWDHIGAFSVFEQRVTEALPGNLGVLKRIDWEYTGADVGGRASWAPDWFGDPERLATRLNAYRSMYATAEPSTVELHDHGAGV